MRRYGAALGMALLLAASVVSGDEVVFKNGDRLSGKIDRLEGGKLVLTSPLLGQVSVDLAQVRNFTSDTPLALHFRDGTVVNQKVSGAGEGHIATEGSAVLPSRIFALADLAAVNPPPKPGPKWSGSASASYTITQGNSETDSASLDINLQRRTENDRTTIKGGWLYSRREDDTTGDMEKTNDKWFGEIKYDYFVGKKLYVFANGRVEQDRVADLENRTLAGAGLGYQWIEKDHLKFSTEAGYAFKYEKLKSETSGESTNSAQGAYHFEAALNKKVRFLHDLRYFPSTERRDDFFITTSGELRFLFTERFFANAKLTLDHDSTPAAGAKHTDWTYLLGVGLNLF